MRYCLFIILCLMLTPTVSAQSDRQHIRAGNRLFKTEKYDKAEVEYRKAVSANSSNPQAHYNLGCSLMQQKKDSAAVAQFEMAGKLETSSMRKAMVYHNIGVICQQHQLYGQAISAYEESLRNNPHDNETRYNLALCKRLQKNQPQNNNKNNQNNKQNKNNKDKNNKQNQKNQQNKDNKNQQQNQQMSKENAEQLLNAAMQQEQATQQRLKDAMRQPRRRQLQKNW